MIKSICTFFFVIVMLPGILSAQSGNIWFEASSQYLLLINKFPVTQDQASAFNTWRMTYKELEDYRSQTARNYDLGYEKLEELQKIIVEQQIADKPFFIRINTNSSKLITGAWVSQDPRYLISPPKNEPEIPEPPVSSNFLVRLIATSHETGPFAVIDDDRVITTDKDLQTFLNNNNIHYSHELVLYIQRTDIPKLTPQQYFMAFHNARLTRRSGAKEHGIYQAAWEKMLRSITDYNVIKYHLQYVYINYRDRIHYRGDTGEITYSHAEIEDHVEFAFGVFEQMPSVTEIEYSNQRDAIEFLRRDTNTDENDSRKEPIDLLSYYAIKQYKDFDSFTGLSQIMRSELTKSSILAKLDPRVEGKLIVSKHLDQPSNYLVYCNHGHDGIPSPYSKPKRSNLVSNDLYSITDTALWSKLNFTAEGIRQLQAGDKLTIPCGKSSNLLYFTKSVTNIPLHLKGSENFIVGEDQTIKAVVTFPIINSGSVQFADKIINAGKFLGYDVKENEVLADLKSDYLEQMLDTDFYIPVEHSLSDSSSAFKIGKNYGRKLVLEKSSNNIKTEIVLYLPPLDNDNQRPLVDVMMNEMASLFVSRRNQQPLRRLIILNVACESYRSIPKWFETYQMSFTLPNNPENAATENIISNELPLVVGSRTSFTSGDSGSYERYAVYPLNVLGAASKNETMQNFVAILSNDGFSPSSNIGTGLKLGVPVEAGSERVILNVESTKGGRQTYP